MSQIKLLHSGGNGVSIVAPDSNPASDRTLKLPSDGDGTILTTNSSVGKILQVLQVKKTDVFTTTNTTSSGTHPWGNDVSGLSLNITMTNASNKVLAILNGTISNSATNYYTYLYLYRHSDYFLGSSTAKTPSGSLATNDVVVMGLDTPGAGTHMYLARVATEGNTAKVGQGQNDSGHNENIGDSTLTLMEIAA